MENTYRSNLTVSAAPHLVTSLDTQKTMMWVLIALAPALAVGVYVFGINALIMTVVCIAACVFFEWAYEKIMKKPNTVKDLSAVVTGTLIAFNVPSTLPIWMAVIGCFVAIILVKQLYGGLGRNFANPAIVARIVLLVSFATQMTTWPLPIAQQTADAVTGATPLAVVGTVRVARGLPSLMNLFIGTIGGSIGEVSTLALLIGFGILLWKKIIVPHTTVAFVLTVFVFAFLYYTFNPIKGVSAAHMGLFHVMAGGVMLGAVFMATDYVTSPIMPLGKIIMGVGCGLFTMIIRFFAGYPEGVSFSILLMNIMTPLIDMLCIKLAYGGGAKKDE
ncbi:MAG: RnfABCDGE type electron transport complex subunit D [Firmicutes bacterium]|nr:RnfABCDGE type electron transport complex subunit D [Bacillota bacterium]